MLGVCCFFFFFKQKTAYEMRISVWSSDVCSSDLYYYAKNLSDKSIVARATYNVTPLKVGPYFFKIECFCFTEERLGPGESARMPLVFYVDSQMRKDPDTKEVRTVTLSYPFYKQEIGRETCRARGGPSG